MSIFQSNIEKTLYTWISSTAKEYVDIDTNGFDELRIASNIPIKLIDWAETIQFTLGALEAGIPLEVIQGRSKLSEAFSETYIKWRKGEYNE